jgi:hypothetical protein
MMRLLGHFIDLAERALAAGVAPERMAAMRCVRPLQRMGEEIADDALPRFEDLKAAIESEFEELEKEMADAAHG